MTKIPFKCLTQTIHKIFCCRHKLFLFAYIKVIIIIVKTEIITLLKVSVNIYEFKSFSNHLVTGFSPLSNGNSILVSDVVNLLFRMSFN